MSAALAASVTTWPEWDRVARLQAGRVDVFRFSLSVPDTRLPGLERVLSRDEHERAARFRYAVHRNRYIVARATLREVLSLHTHEAAGDLRFRYGPNGKPELATLVEPIAFNLAHADDVGVLAVGRVSLVGVDVESCAAFTELDELAGRYFSPAERAAFDRVDTESRRLAFFLGWTRKEAFIKATGEGLSRALDSFDVELRPGHPPAVLRVPPRFADGTWCLSHLEPKPGYVGAVASCSDSDGRGALSHTHQWSLTPW